MTSFVIELDTTAPVLTFGAATPEPQAGDPLQVAYTLDEGVVVSAQLANGSSVLPMRVDVDLLTLAVPSDWPEGLATITALVADDVGNTAEYAMTLAISGVIGPPPTPPTPGPSGGAAWPAWVKPPAREHRTSRTRSRASVRSRSAVRARRGTSVRVGGVTAARHAVRHDARWVLTAQTVGRSRARHVIASHAPGRTVTTIRRRDDPGTEHALLMLGVL